MEATMTRLELIRAALMRPYYANPQDVEWLLERLDEMREAVIIDMQCPACDGTGKFDEDIGDTLVECKNCGGTGIWGEKTRAALAKLEE
jgi:hypothetical protein